MRRRRRRRRRNRRPAPADAWASRKHCYGEPSAKIERNDRGDDEVVWIQIEELLSQEASCEMEGLCICNGKTHAFRVQIAWCFFRWLLSPFNPQPLTRWKLRSFAKPVGKHRPEVSQNRLIVTYRASFPSQPLPFRVVMPRIKEERAVAVD